MFFYEPVLFLICAYSVFQGYQPFPLSPFPRLLVIWAQKIVYGEKSLHSLTPSPPLFYDFDVLFYIFTTSLVAQLVKNLPAMEETRVQPLGQGDPLEKETATHSSILPWRIPWTEQPGGP